MLVKVTLIWPHAADFSTQLQCMSINRLVLYMTIYGQAVILHLILYTRIIHENLTYDVIML